MHQCIFSLILILVVMGVVACQKETEIYPENVVAVADFWGVPPKRIVTVAQQIGIDTNTISDPYFIIDYYSHRFEEFQQIQGRPPTMKEVDEMVTGFIAKCASSSGTTDYIYFSEHVHWYRGEIALAFTIFPELYFREDIAPEDRAFNSIQNMSLRDPSLNPRSETYWETCIERYRKEQADC